MLDGNKVIGKFLFFPPENPAPLPEHFPIKFVGVLTVHDDLMEKELFPEEIHNCCIRVKN
jgi:hypothetical protein